MGQKTTLMKRATAFLIGIFLFIGAPGVQAVTIDGAAPQEWSMENAAAENGAFGYSTAMGLTKAMISGVLLISCNALSKKVADAGIY